MYRLNKFLAEQTGVSRREADNLIADGRVRINQEVAVLGRRFDETRDEIIRFATRNAGLFG